MKAIIASQDKISQDVLKKSFVRQGFSEQDIVNFNIQKSDLSEEQLYNSIILLDLDQIGAEKLLVEKSKLSRIIVFGSVDAKRKLNHYPESKYVLKPFTGEKIQQLMTQILLEDTNSSVAKLLPQSAMPKGTLSPSMQKWQSLTQAIKQERQKLSSLLQATPDQLKTMLTTHSMIPSLDPGSAASGIAIDALPIRNVLIAEGDTTTAQTMAKIFATKCVLSVDICEDGNSAWDRLKNPICRYDLIIFNWELKEVGGLALYNRLRLTAHLRHIPIIVTSKNLSQNDFRLIDDDFCATLLEYPIQERLFVKKVDTIVTTAITATKYLEKVIQTLDQVLKESSINSLLPGADRDDIMTYGLKLLGDRYLKQSRYEEAKTSYSAAWHFGDKRLSLITGLSKAFLYLGKTKDAQRLLLTADALAPKSVERLCLMGEINLTNQKPEEAAKTFAQALDVDRYSMKAAAGKNLSEAIMATETVHNKQALSVDEFPSYLNLVGISLSRSHQTEKALGYYKSALFFVRDREKQGKIWFNIGMCYMRDDDTTHAEHAFNEALKLTGGALDKAQKYLKKESFGTQSARVGKAAKPAHPPDAHFAEDLRENDDLFANPAMHT